MNYLSVDSVSRSYGEKQLFSDLSFGLAKGQKMALIARNGTGKTSLLRIIAGLEQPEGGSVTLRNGIRIGYLAQQPDLDDSLYVQEAIYDPKAPKVLALRAYEECVKNEAGEKEMQAALDEMERLKAWDYETLAQQVLSKLHINDLKQKVATLSGGQKKRLALARMLIDAPDLLILDEPTNHLDIETTEWLEDYLANANLALFMVTHDRYFLDRVCDSILELERGVLQKYPGNFSFYLEKKAERQQQQLAEVDKAKNLMGKELEWLRRQPKARGTKSKARIDAFDAIADKASKRILEDQVTLEVKTERLGGKILEMHHLKKAFGDLQILEDFSYKFKRGERVGIIGKNGVGKSTFIRMILGEEPYDGGKIVHGETVKFGYYSQDGLTFDEDKRVLEVVRDVADVLPLNKGKKITAIQLLERFLFPKHMHFQQIRKLSGGEQRRLYLLIILMDNPNFLILDEPTNDLDIVTLGILEDFLSDFGGCLIIISHDRFFMDKLVEHLFIFKGEGQIKDFPGNYAQYQIYKEQEKESKQVKAAQQKKEKSSEVNEERYTNRLSYQEKREFGKLEKEMSALEKEKIEYTEKLTAAASDHQKIQEYSAKLTKIVQQLEEKEMRWFELAERNQ